MDLKLKIHNSLSNKKELFTPITPGFVGLYVCGPTVYGEPHLGHARPYITFDVLFRFLEHQGLKVRYVRNITDVGHLEDELAGAGEDKIAKKARLEKLEPMEVVQTYTNSFHDKMDMLNTKRPSIEPRASGHIIEQIEMIRQIMDNGLAYEVNGSVYFDVMKYHKDHNYGELSGRILEDLIAGAGEERRALEGQAEKRNSVDFALWKNASPEHIMRWPSPWGIGFPGWHLECSVMSAKYLGETFDIHGGGMDLLFPHHECEIAQAKGATGKKPVNYWMHNNMITINGKKMGKSLGNFITLSEFFSGEHDKLDQAYSPMTIRFFILQAHYRSTVDFSNEALQAAEKGYTRMVNAKNTLNKLVHPGNENPGDASTDQAILDLCERCYTHLNDDLNTAQVLAELFEVSSKANAYQNKQADIAELSLTTFNKMKSTFNDFFSDILGIRDESSSDQGGDKLNGVMDLVIDIRKSARENKDWATSDKIRDSLNSLEIQIKDGKEGTTWN